MTMLRALDAQCNLKNQICPKCGARGRFAPHGRYKRNLVTLIFDIPFDTIIEIKRVRCRSCKSTHAIIPFDVVPYCAHSTELSARLFELREYADYSIGMICEKLSLSVTTYYRIVKRSLGRLITLASVSTGTRLLRKLLKDVEELVASHLSLHRIKPFESGRLAPAFFDP